MGQSNSHVSKEDMNEIFKNVNKSLDVSRADFKLVKLLSVKNKTKVYLVERYQTHQRYAMKIMDKYSLYNNGRVKSVLEELKIYQQTQLHPFILNIHYAFQDDVNLFLIQDYCQGSDLAYQMKFHDVFSEKETLFIISCLILALEQIHRQKIVNIGLTMDHILLDEKGYPKICNFQQAILLDQDDQEDVEVLNNDLITEFLAPEVLLRMSPGIEADFYSLGIIMCYMMTGKKQDENQPMTRENLINNILKKNIKNVKQSDLPEGWTDFAGDFINKLTQKKPENRLGYYGSEELKKHKWLQNQPWQKIEESIIIDCYVPKLKNVETSTLSQLLSSEKNLPQLNEKEQPFQNEAIKLIGKLTFQEQFESYYYSIDQDREDRINSGSEVMNIQDEIKSLQSFTKYQSQQQQQQNAQQQQPVIYQNMPQQQLQSSQQNDNNDFDSERKSFAPIHSRNQSSTPFQ